MRHSARRALAFALVVLFASPIACGGAIDPPDPSAHAEPAASASVSGSGSNAQPPAPSASASTSSSAPAGSASNPPSGAPDGGASGQGASCTNDLSNVGAGDFAISLDVTTTQTGTVALLNQRNLCNTSVFWDLELVDGMIQLEMDDTYYNTDAVTPGSRVNDGQVHHLQISRVSQVIAVAVDGNAVPTSAPDGGGEAWCGEQLGALPPLATGVDVCDGVGPSVPLAGAIANVCVSALGT